MNKKTAASLFVPLPLNALLSISVVFLPYQYDNVATKFYIGLKYNYCGFLPSFFIMDKVLSNRFY